MKIIHILYLTLILLGTGPVTFAESSLKVGDIAPDFTITDPSGKSISLHSLRGKIVLLDFWASWCTPCRMANEELVPIYNTFHNHGFEIFSVSLDKKKDAWINAIKKDKLAWPYHGSDFQEYDSKPVITYEIEGIPSAFLIDEKGVIIAKNIDVYDLEAKLQYLFLEQVHFFPKAATSKILFTGKAKFSIEDKSGNILLKGKAEEIDITGLKAGEYTIKYENKIEKFEKKINTHASTTFSPARVDDKITLSREADFEIINTRGKVIKKGKGIIVEASDLTPGLFYLSIDGHIHSFYKK